jgi:7-cyano-7-deazaguanine synthase
MKKKAIVLVSGGMDSVVALYEAHRTCEVLGGLSFNYGSKHNHKEIPCAEWHCKGLGIPHLAISLGFMGETFKSALLTSGGAIPDGHYEEQSMKQTVVPFRNGIMLSIAGGYAESLEAKAVVIAAHAGDHAIYPDCREDFMKAIAEAVRLGTYAEIEVLRPFIRMTKAEIARRGQELGVDFSKTWSCYKGEEIHCGTCGTCVERREAFMLAGLKDPTPYAEISALPLKPATVIHN